MIAPGLIQAAHLAAQNAPTPQLAQSERGSTAFYTLVLLPVLLSIAAVAIDTSGWYSVRDDAQQLADGLAVQAASFLPDRDAARRFLDGALLPPNLSGATVQSFFPEGTSLSAGVAVDVRYRGTMVGLLPGLPESAFRVRRTATAEIVPADILIIAADGSSLRPGTGEVDAASGNTVLQAPWGEAASWPASGYFHCADAPANLSSQSATNSQVTGDYQLLWSDETFRRWSTQSCFNPVLLPLKRGVISLLDEIAAAEENRLGMIVTPGDIPGPGYSVLKRLRAEPGETSAPVLWTGYIENGVLGDESCLLFSDPESALSALYELPSASLPPALRSTPGCAGPLIAPPCGERHQASGHLAECYLQSALTLRQAYYWHAARLGAPNAPALPRPVAALQEALRQLEDADLGGDTTRLRKARGSLATAASRRIILISDTLPDPDVAESSGLPTLNELLQQMARHQVSLTVVGYSHQGLSDSQRQQLLSAAARLHALEGASFGLRTFVAGSPDSLQREVLPRLLLVDRQIVLRG